MIKVYVGCGKPEVIKKRRRGAVRLAKTLKVKEVIFQEVDGPAPRSVPEGFEIVKESLEELEVG